ncbi:MAG: type II secretion system protein [Thermodesulfovibrionales bacterium]
MREKALVEETSAARSDAGAVCGGRNAGTLSPGWRDGFTLLEIMIALAVIGGLLATLLFTLQYHLGIAGRHEFLTVATLLAKEKMAEVEKGAMETKGDFAGPYSGYGFRVEKGDAPFPGLQELSVIVSNGSEQVRITELRRTPQ